MCTPAACRAARAPRTGGRAGYSEPRQPAAMKRFLRENWIWIAAPLVLVAAALCVLLYVVGNESETSGFVYTLG